jgi:hypothetical protein
MTPRQSLDPTLYLGRADHLNARSIKKHLKVSAFFAAVPLGIAAS